MVAECKDACHSCKDIITCDRHAMVWFWSLMRIEIFHILQILLVFVENWYSLAKWLWKAGFSGIVLRSGSGRLGSL